MPSNAHGDGPLKALITVVAWFIDDVNQWRRDAILTNCIGAMTGRTVRVEATFADLCIHRESVWEDDVRQRLVSDSNFDFLR